MNAPITDDETERLNWLKQSGILNSPREDAFDDITRLAAQVCGVPISAVSLIDEERQWFKSIVGLTISETPRDLAFCAHTILTPKTMVIPDATQDERFKDNPLVLGQPEIRFYAGAPLITSDGLTLGSLCLIDRVARTLTAEQQAVLEMLARQVVGRIELQRHILLQDKMVDEQKKLLTEQNQLMAEQEKLLAEKTQAEQVLRQNKAKLRQSEEQLRAVVDQAMDGIYLFDPVSRRLIQTNAALRTMLGYSEEQAAELSLYDIVAHDKNSIDRNIQTLLLQGKTDLGERQYLCRDGSVLITEVRAQTLRYNGNEAFCVMVHDVTERRRAEMGQSNAEREYQSLFENAAEGIFRTTVEGRYLQANPALACIYGYETPEAMIAGLTNISGQLYVEPGRRAEFQRLMRKDGMVSAFESQVYRRDGAMIWISESARLVRDAAGALHGYEGFVQDISERKAVEVQQALALWEAQDQADRDPLTGLLNHRAFHRKLEEEASRMQRSGLPCAVAMLDLDNFGFFNKAYGHVVGDGVLQMVAERLQTVCRSYDTVARFGGDEFALVLPSINAASVADMEARLRVDMANLSFRLSSDGTSIPITVSVGMAFLTDAYTDADYHKALRRADERLLRSKTGGASETEADQVRSLAADTVLGFSMLDALVTAVDNKDRYTRRHSEDVMNYSLMIVRELRLGEETEKIVAVAALLHDVGKIGVPDSILRKPSDLTNIEFEAIRQHPQMGAAIVSTVPGLENILDAVRYHHERWDGKGYPVGLKAEETPLIARLMAVADAFSAMTTDRPYRKGMEKEKALSILSAGAGTQWDSICTKAFVRSFSKREEPTSSP